MTLLDECILLLSQMKGVLIVISDTQNAQSPTKEKKTYTVEEIAEQLDISKKVAYSLVKSGQFNYKERKLWLQSNKENQVFQLFIGT